MILGLQVIASIFALIMIYFAYLHYRKGDISKLEIILWLVVWMGAILLTLFPNTFGVFAEKISISRVFDLAVVGGFILIIPLVYVAYIRTKRLEKKIEDFVRQDALKGLVGEKKK